MGLGRFWGSDDELHSRLFHWSKEQIRHAMIAPSSLLLIPMLILNFDWNSFENMYRCTVPRWVGWFDLFWRCVAWWSKKASEVVSEAKRGRERAPPTQVTQHRNFRNFPHESRILTPFAFDTATDTLFSQHKDPFQIVFRDNDTPQKNASWATLGPPLSKIYLCKGYVDEYFWTNILELLTKEAPTFDSNMRTFSLFRKKQHRLCNF
jgi:hypothetical protein